MRIDAALSNSFGFGGTNGSLIFSRFKRLKHRRAASVDSARTSHQQGRRARRDAACAGSRGPERYPVLLDSAAEGPLRTFSVLAFATACCAVRTHAGPDTDPLRSDSRAVLDDLDAWLRANALRATLPSRLPFTGGWFVLPGYELAREIEPVLRLPAPLLPLSAFALRSNTWRVHRACQRPVLAVSQNGDATTHARLVLPAASALRRSRSRQPRTIRTSIAGVEEPPDRHLERVRRGQGIHRRRRHLPGQHLAPLAAATARGQRRAARSTRRCARRTRRRSRPCVQFGGMTILSARRRSACCAVEGRRSRHASDRRHAAARRRSRAAMHA